MPYELQIALRYLLAKRKQAFISVISLVSILGVSVGVMALVIALALMTGLQQGVRDRILGASAHVYVWKQGGSADYTAEVARLEAVPGVAGAAPALLTKALVSSHRREAFVTIKGIDPALEPRVTELARAMIAGDLNELASVGEELPGVVVGQTLASELGVFVGDAVTVITPAGTLSPVGMMPRQRRLRIVGLFALGLFEFDQAYAFVGLDTARRLAGTDEITHLEVRVADIYRAPAVARRIMADLGPEYLTQDWTEMNQSLYSALWLEKVAISIAIGLIVMVAALNIVASLILLVMEKHRDIAILKTMGASSRSVMVIFMLQGAIIGLVGTGTGSTAGVVLAHLLDRYRLVRIPSDVYQLSHLPFTVLPGDLTIVVAGALAICFVATIYPSRQAARLDPAQALRYE